jgi:FtsZ-interacting cell division protein YlmF
MKIRALPVALLIAELLTVATITTPWINQPCLADIFDQGNAFPPSPRSMLQQRTPTQVPHEPTLEDLLHPVEYPTKYLQAVPLHDLAIPGLDKNSLDTLGFNYFVVVDNTPFTDMSSLYRSNRLLGKSNFVTVDSIIHPYFAFTNRVLATAIEHHVVPELSSLLRALLVGTLNEYTTTQDVGVRQDIEHNIAYLAVGLKLLDPKFTVPEKGNSAQLAADEIKLIEEGGVATSKIFEYDEDYSNYKPIGWYNASPLLQNFYRARQWISHMGYPLTEGTAGKETSVNNFRRSILLYQCLDKGTINGTPAWVTWKKLYQVWKILGCFEGYQNNMLLPDRYETLLKQLTPDMHVTMSALAEPLYRAKLILAMKRQFATGLRSASINEMQSGGHSKESQPVFALFPPSGDPEWPWIKAIAYGYVDQDQGPELIPISLSCLQAHGSGQANNIMLARLGRLHPAMVGFLPELDRLVRTGPEPRPWKVLDEYSRFPTEGAQGALRTDTWMSRRAESAFAAWVDNHLTIAPADNTQTAAATAASQTTAKTATPPATQNTAQPNSTTTSSTSQTADATRPKMFSSYTEEALAFTRTNARKQAYFHYLEPAPYSFQAICTDAQTLARQLGQLGYLAPTDAQRFMEFIKLNQRLTQIAVSELKDKVLSVGDLKLLGNIDKTMGPVDVPLQGILYASGKSDGNGGVNMVLGHPAQLYVILQLGEKVWLARGALYSYYEIGGGSISQLHWQRKQDFSLLRVPFWADKFDVVVNPKDAETGTAARRPRPGGVQSRPQPSAGSPTGSSPPATRTAPIDAP